MDGECHRKSFIYRWRPVRRAHLSGGAFPGATMTDDHSDPINTTSIRLLSSPKGAEAISKTAPCGSLSLSLSTNHLLKADARLVGTVLHVAHKRPSPNNITSCDVRSTKMIKMHGIINNAPTSLSLSVSPYIRAVQTPNRAQ